MANIFGGLTALVVILSLWVGYKNNVEFEKQVELTDKAERDLKNAQANQATVLDAIKEQEGLIESYTAELAEKKDLPAEMKLQLVELENKKVGLEKKVKNNQKQIASLEAASEEYPDPEVVIPRIMEVKSKIAQLKVDVAGEEESIDSIKDETAALAARANEFQKLNELRSSGKSFPTLATTVKSVYGNWGFVTLNGGNAQGVVPGSTLDVVRDGEVVAKLKVTAVEQNRAAADILPDALPEVVSLRSGDKVIAAK